MTIDKFSRREQCIRLWLHEVYRVVMDRLINHNDKQLVEVSSKYFFYKKGF